MKVLEKRFLVGETAEDIANPTTKAINDELIDRILFIVSLLLENGASPLSISKSGQNALDIARKNAAWNLASDAITPIIRLLEKHY